LSEKTADRSRSKKPDALVLHDIHVTHPDRVICETGHITKGDLASYYATVAAYMLPQLSRHPLSLLRCPAGIDNQCFYQRNPGNGLGSDVHPFEFESKGKTYEYLYIEDEKGLLEIVQMGAIEIHPWGASIDKIDSPNWMISISTLRPKCRSKRLSWPRGICSPFETKRPRIDTQMYRRKGTSCYGAARRQGQVA
jgi:bifunctional non-homologous end joining protein LigD